MTSKQTNFLPAFTGVINLSYDVSDNTSKDLLQKGIENGCQAFIISDDVFCNFLDDFYEVHDKSVQVFPNKHFIIYQTAMEVFATKFVGSLLASSAIGGKKFRTISQ